MKVWTLSDATCLLAAALIAGCGSTADQSSGTASAEAKAATALPEVAETPSAQARHAAREWWSHISQGPVAVTADRAHGISLALSESADHLVPDYYSVPEKITGSPPPPPPGWTDVRANVGELINNVNALIDADVIANGGDADKARGLAAGTEKMTASFCDALASARRHYVAEGGRANDLTFFYMSAWSNPTCVDFADPVPRRTRLLRDTIAADNGEAWPSFSSDDVPTVAYEEDHARRFSAGTAISVVEQRRSPDSDQPEQCRAVINEKSWWFACRTLEGITPLGPVK